MVEDPFPVEWMGLQAVVSLPEHIDVSNAGQIREELLSVINRGAAVLIAEGKPADDHVHQAAAREKIPVPVPAKGGTRHVQRGWRSVIGVICCPTGAPVAAGL